MNMEKRTGGCLCGAVRFEANLKSTGIHVCHCSICRRLSGGPALAVDCEADIEITGKDNLRWYRSSPTAERGFCGICGATMFFRLLPEYGTYCNISAGTLDDDNGLTVTSHIYIDSKPPYYDFADAAPRLTEKAFLAQLQEQNPDGSC